VMGESTLVVEAGRGGVEEALTVEVGKEEVRKCFLAGF